MGGINLALLLAAFILIGTPLALAYLIKTWRSGRPGSGPPTLPLKFVLEISRPEKSSPPGGPPKTIDTKPETTKLLLPDTPCATAREAVAQGGSDGQIPELARAAVSRGSRSTRD